MGDRTNLGNTTNPPTTRVASYGMAGRGMGTFEKRKGTKPIEGAYELPEHFTDKQDIARTARLYAESVAYPNLAGDSFVVEQARTAVLSALKDVYNVMEFLRNKWLILYRLYRGENLAQFSYGRPQLHSPEPFKAVETVHPRVMRTLFGNQRWFKLYGVGDQDDVGAKAQEGMCRHQFREMNFLDEASRFVRDGLIYGTSVQKCYWKQEIGDMRYRTGKRVPDKDFPGATKVELSEIEREELLFDGNVVKNVSIFDYYTSPNATSVADSEWCADRSAWADFEVKQMGELGHWIHLEKLKDRAGQNDMSFGDEFKERKSYSYGVFDPREASWSPHVPHYTVIDWWGPLVIAKKGQNYTTRLCNVVMIEPDNMATIVRITENPYWHKQKPYQSWRPIQLHQEFYGIGMIEMIARLSQEKDIKRNLLMAATQLEANPMWLLSDEANIPDGQLILQPGLVLRVPDVANSIAPLHVPQVSDAALKAENILTKDIRETNGTTSPMMGAQDPFGKGKTATQHTSEIDEANSRLVGMIENYEHQVVEPMIDQMTWNNQQFSSYDKTIREVGALGMRYQDRYTIRPVDLLGRFLVQPLASHRLTTKQVQVQQLVNILDRAPVINQMYGPTAVKMPKLLAYILEYGFDIRNADDFITVPPEEGGLLTAMEEHEVWYHGEVPPRRADDNDMRHIFAHMQEMMSERFELLEDTSPGTAARARAHVAEHQRKVALVKEQQEKAMMEMAQMNSMMGQGQNGGSPVPGAAGPGQEAGSPQVRRNENERGERPGREEQSEAMRGAPNAGAQ